MVKHWFHRYLHEHYTKDKTLSLDIGCGTRPYHDNYNCEYVGLDLPHREYENLTPDIFGEASNLPFKNDAFDLVICASVVPYIKNIDNFFEEIHRILKQNGTAVIIIMNLRGLALHPTTHFENRYNSSKLNKKLKEHKFKSIMKNNPKAFLWATYFDLTSVYGYAIVKPLK